MPPVTLPIPAAELAVTDAGTEAVAYARPELRLAPESTAPSAPGHVEGAPATCSCRDCAMARHPAAAARLHLVTD